MSMQPYCYRCKGPVGYFPHVIRSADGSLAQYLCRACERQLTDGPLAALLGIGAKTHVREVEQHPVPWEVCAPPGRLRKIVLEEIMDFEKDLRAR